jgi:multiple sugar transport system substrate-binding protein
MSLLGEQVSYHVRISQFKNQEAWIKAGMTSGAANKYLGGIGVSLNSPNMVLDLRISQNHRYQTDVLGSVVIDFLTAVLVLYYV